MLQQQIAAVFENGRFRVLTPLAIPLVEGQHVQLLLEVADTPNDPLALAFHVYDGLSEQEIADIEAVALDRSAFFEAERDS